ncbi:hypothetical protein ACFQT0_29535 [Hymenobacter humi]|uniref:TonB-dependent receptor n=1 Tax=Hymenobacter humi TaxID=1411620 RepID=A0ABW2UC55_9BACT
MCALILSASKAAASTPGSWPATTSLADDKTTLNWVGGFAYTHRTEPDWRRVRYIRPLGVVQGESTPAPFGVSTPNDPSLTESGRYFSNLNERVSTLAVNVVHQLTKDTTNREGGIKLKAGLYTERKDRDFSARFFGYGSVGNTSVARTLPVGQVFAPENLTGRDGGFTLEEGTDPNDSYAAHNTLLAGYASVTVPVGKFTGTAGFRGEYNDQQVTSELRGGGLTDGGRRIFSPCPRST